MRMRPPIIDEEEPTALAMQPIMRQAPPGRPKMSDQEMESRGRVEYGSDGVPKANSWYGGTNSADFSDPDQPPYTFPLPKGSMNGKPYPTEREFGGGDTLYSNIYRWEQDNGAFGLEYDSPEYKKFIDDYHAKNKLPPRYNEKEFVDFLGRELGLTSPQERWDAYHGRTDKLPDEKYNELLQRFRAGGARTPAPKAQGMFGRPPGGITSNRMMIDE